MASTERNDDNNMSGIRTLHDMFHIVGDQMTARDVKVLKFLYSAVLSRSLLDKINDGFSFLLALEKIGRIDDSNFKHILHLLRIVTRHDLTPSLTLRKRKTVIADPVDEFLEQTARSNTIIPFKRKSSCLEDSSHLQSAACSSAKAQTNGDGNKMKNSNLLQTENTSVSSNKDSLSSPPNKRLRRSPRHTKDYSPSLAENCQSTKGVGEPNACIKTKLTCDIRLRVRAEYCHHDTALDGNIHSNKPELIEKQFEKFMQANTILKSRDLGSIICDIKFSELTYLDAFWRDYINGSLLDALKGVFITESLKQAVGHEAIKLLVNVDEDDYEKGRLILLKNLRQ